MIDFRELRDLCQLRGSIESGKVLSKFKFDALLDDRNCG